MWLLLIISKCISVWAIEQIAYFLCTDYVNATIEFFQAYIQVLDIIHNQREGRGPGVPGAFDPMMI